MRFGFIFALGAMLFWGVGDFLIQRTTRKIGDIEALAWIGILGSIGLLPFVYRELPKVLVPGNAKVLTILGILTFIIALLDFEALKRGKLSVVEVILEFELPVTILLSIAFFRENLAPIQWGLVAVVFLGTFLIALRPDEFRKSLRLEQGVLFAAIAAVGMGFINFLTAAGARFASPLLAIWIPWVIFTFLSLVLLWDQGRLRSFFRDSAGRGNLIAAMGAFDTVAWLCYAFAVREGSVGLMTAVTESYPAIGVFLGMRLNRESIAAHQLLGAVLTIAASFLLGFYS